MKTARILLFVLLCFWLGRSAHAGDCPVDDLRLDDRIMVGVAVGATIEDFIAAFEAAHTDHNITLEIIDSIEPRETYLLQLGPPGLSPEIVDLLEEDLDPVNYPGLLQWSDFLYEVETAEGGTGSLWFNTGDGGNNLYLGQYPIELMALPLAQALSTGAGVAVAVLDTGVDASHPALQGRVLSNGFNFITNDANTDDVGDGQDNDGDGSIDEQVGHGTYVAALVALVAPDVKILPVVVLNPDGRSDIWIVTKGIYYAIDQGVEVINASLGTTYRPNGFEAAIDDAKRLGIVVVGAAGNEAAHCREHPAQISAAFGVVATDDEDVKADFSNYHDNTFISAPGDSKLLGPKPGQFDPERSIVSAIPGGDYAYWEGTSMATPFVSGAVALIRSQHPEWDPDDPDQEPEFIYNAIEDALVSTAVNIDAQNPDFPEELGAGRIDIGAAVSLGPPAPTLGDIDNDGSVGVKDLLSLLGSWGPCNSCHFCPADLDSDCQVGVTDLLILLGNWG
ncbi:MAG: S8 family serine peptidase [Planctomycetes bacterium]|nr:S8 family serine peptidase [Planctomycetota bacterium]